MNVDFQVQTFPIFQFCCQVDSVHTFQQSMSQIGSSTRLEASNDPRWRIRFEDLKDICLRVNIWDRRRKIQVWKHGQSFIFRLEALQFLFTTEINVMSKKWKIYELLLANAVRDWRLKHTWQICSAPGTEQCRLCSAHGMEAMQTLLCIWSGNNFQVPKNS